MPKLKVLTDYSYIVETSDGEKIGVLVDYNAGTTERCGVELFSSEGTFTCESIQDLETVLGEKFVYEELQHKDNTVSSKALGEYPINDTDNIIDIQYDDPLQIGTFRKSKRSKKRFYPGWWIVQTESGSYLPRLTLSVDIYDERNGTELLHGPFKTYMEVTYTLKQI